MSQTVGDSIGLGGRIATARTDAGIRTQMEFARQLGVTRSAVSEWERGKSSPSTGNLGRIAQLTEKSFDWLATGRTTRVGTSKVAPADPLTKVALDRITPDTPLRLNVAAALAYPDGSMTASGLRKEALKGHLILERTAGKYYTTLAAITRMRELCQQNPKVRGSDFTKPGETNADLSSTPPLDPSATAAIERARAAWFALGTAPKERWKRSSIPKHGAGKDL
jgi:transcriptional regulator with XRE-family HTH domain